MIDNEGRAVIVYNGEVFNFHKIKDDLENLGHSFSSKTDAEVVLKSYLAWGERCLFRFNGMFAFAIWDRRERTLFLARDRIGIKPLYYAQRGDAFIFASAIKSILCWEEMPRKVNTRALDYYFTFRYNHLNETLFKDIFKVPPGHYMKIRLDDKHRLSFKTYQYWDIEANSLSLKQKDIEKQLAERIKGAVKRALISDVPLGVFFSSGIDSSTIVGIMKKELEMRTNTFTVGLKYSGFQDELLPARFTTDYFKTKHTEYVCGPDMISILPRIIWNTDELNADPTLMPTYLISEIASKKVKVILSGEGSDELFGGYERTLLMKYAWDISRSSASLINCLPWLIGLAPRAILDKIFKYSSLAGVEGLHRLSGFCKNIQNIGASYLDIACIFNQDEKRMLYGQKLQSRPKEENIADTINRQYFNSKSKNSEELFNRLSYFELKTRLPNDLLTKVDTMTMAHSLEARVPYLDHNLVEFAFAIPSSLKLSFFREKYILRRAALRYLPREIIKVRKEHFSVPIHLWFQNELHETVGRILTRENIENTGYLNYEFVQHAYKNYNKGAFFYARQIWSILCFLIWHKIYIESDRVFSFSHTNESLDSLFTSS